MDQLNLANDEFVAYLHKLTWRDHARPAIDIGSDGSIRYQCPECGSWWYGKQKFCSECGQRIKY